MQDGTTVKPEETGLHVTVSQQSPGSWGRTEPGGAHWPAEPTDWRRKQRWRHALGSGTVKAMSEGSNLHPRFIFWGVSQAGSVEPHRVHLQCLSSALRRVAGLFSFPPASV